MPQKAALVPKSPLTIVYENDSDDDFFSSSAKPQTTQSLAEFLATTGPPEPPEEPATQASEKKERKRLFFRRNKSKEKPLDAMNGEGAQAHSLAPPSRLQPPGPGRPAGKKYVPIITEYDTFSTQDSNKADGRGFNEYDYLAPRNRESSILAETVVTISSQDYIMGSHSGGGSSVKSNGNSKEGSVGGGSSIKERRDALGGVNHYQREKYESPDAYRRPDRDMHPLSTAPAKGESHSPYRMEASNSQKEAFDGDAKLEKQASEGPFTTAMIRKKNVADADAANKAEEEKDLVELELSKRVALVRREVGLVEVIERSPRAPATGRRVRHVQVQTDRKVDTAATQTESSSPEENHPPLPSADTSPEDKAESREELLHKLQQAHSQLFAEQRAKKRLMAAMRNSRDKFEALSGRAYAKLVALLDEREKLRKETKELRERCSYLEGLVLDQLQQHQLHQHQQPQRG
ncbi:uncharacterized protein VTP21DRAFT_750 [Calcarisporiella thermophila]|uniref:uncharacterized protein n=1 Tax=Calcarisporiella thermophila TaxID=911321 RepID=UPI003742BDA8